MTALVDRQGNGEVLVLDWGNETGLARRGITQTRGASWAGFMGDPSAIVKSVHVDDLKAYADIVTANVYSTEPCALTMIGKIDKMDEWNSMTVTLVRK